MAKLPKKKVNYKFKIGNNGTLLAKVAGWGKTETGKGSEQLLEADMTIVEWKECKKMHTIAAPYIRDQHICARQTDNATKPTDTCQGDSGGPLVQYYNNDNVQTGITSFGLGCGKKEFPGVYARVDHFIDWIDEVIKKENKQDNKQARSARLLGKSNVDVIKTSGLQNSKLIDQTTRKGLINETEIEINPVILGGEVPEENSWKFMVNKLYLKFPIDSENTKFLRNSKKFAQIKVTLSKLIYAKIEQKMPLS